MARTAPTVADAGAMQTAARIMARQQYGKEPKEPGKRSFVGTVRNLAVIAADNLADAAQKVVTAVKEAA